MSRKVIAEYTINGAHVSLLENGMGCYDCCVRRDSFFGERVADESMKEFIERQDAYGLLNELRSYGYLTAKMQIALALALGHSKHEMVELMWECELDVMQNDPEAVKSYRTEVFGSKFIPFNYQWESASLRSDLARAFYIHSSEIDSLSSKKLDQYLKEYRKARQQKEKQIKVEESEHKQFSASTPLPEAEASSTGSGAVSQASLPRAPWGPTPGAGSATSEAKTSAPTVALIRAGKA